MAPMRDYEDNEANNRRRRGGGRLLGRLRGSRNGNGTNSTLNQSRKSTSSSQPKSAPQPKQKSVLDALQTLRVKSDDQHSVASSQAPSLALTQSTVSTAFSSSTGTSFHSRHSHLTNNPLLSPQGLRSQNHSLPGLSPGLWEPRPLSTTGAPSLSHLTTDRPNARTHSPRGGELRKRIRTATSIAAQPSSLYSAVSSGAPRKVVEDLVSNDPGATAEQTPGGMTALHCAIERYDTSAEILMLMLASNPAAAGIRSAEGLNCVDLLWTRFIEPADYRSSAVKERAAALRCSLEDIVNSEFTMNRQTRAEHALQENQDLRVFWNTMASFVTAACHSGTTRSAGPFHSPQQAQHKLLHDCIRLDCDPLFIRFVAALHPEQVREPTCPAEQQRYPIHLAALQSAKSLEAVLRLFPRLASQEDGDGRLPLHLAIESGVDWEGGIASLVQNSPKSLGTPDPITGLLPAVLAATTDDVNTIYCLLSSNPMEVMNYALHT